MKIYDIISEAPATAPVVALAKPPKTTRRAKTKPIPAPAAGNPKMDRVTELIKKVILRDKIGGQIVNNKMVQAMGGYLRAVKILGYGALAAELYTQKTAIDILVAEGQISKEDGSAAYRMQAGKFIAAIMASFAFRGVIGLITTLSGLRWMIRIGGGLAGAPSGGATIVLALATEAAIVWLVNKLATPEGQTMLAWMVLNIIDPSAVWMWNMGFGKFFGEIKEISPAAGEKVNAATQADAQKRATAKGGQGANPAAGAAVPAKAAIDATSTDQDPMAAALNLKTDDVLKANEKKWGVGNAAFPKGNAAKFVDQSELNSKAPR